MCQGGASLAAALPNVIVVKARGRILHYLNSGRGDDNCSSFRSAMTAQEYADREHCRWDRHKVTHWSMFTDSDVPPPHIATESDLAYAWALDRSVTTLQTDKFRVR
ncbi:hypothetical protein D1007_60449 [Hordeum vulgare]|nr:hypothetical protein D1007_60449 [Hordeum vulgare]